MAESSDSQPESSAPAASWLDKMLLACLLLGVLSLAAVTAAGPAHRFAGLALPIAFQLLWIAAAGGAAAAAVALSALLSVPAARRRANLRRAVVACVLGLLAAGAPVLWRATAPSAPLLYDVTTDTLNPPPFRALLPLRAQAGAPAFYGGPALAAAQVKAYPDIRPQFFKLPAARVYDAALQIIRDSGWRVAARSPTLGTFEATRESFWFGLRYDLAVRIQGNDAISRLDMRVAARERFGGSNAATQLRALQARLSQTLGKNF